MKQNPDITMCGSPCLVWCGVVARINAITQCHAQWDVEGSQKGESRTQVLVPLSGKSAAAAGSDPEFDAAFSAAASTSRSEPAAAVDLPGKGTRILVRLPRF